MKLAKIENDAITRAAYYKDMFPNTSFAVGGPSDDFLTENSVKKVRSDLAHNPATHRLVPVAPYLQDDVVYDVIAEVIPQAVLDAQEAARREQLIASFTVEAQARIDEFAKARGYGSILSACSYTTSSVPRYASDAVHAIAKRDAWWVALNAIMNDVLLDNRAEPVSFEEILPELPELTWPQ